MVQGLTSFVNYNSHIYLDKYELHGTKVIIDGNSLCCSLYRLHFEPKNSCFSGDYDRYADLVRSFFCALSECEVTPYVLFDGKRDDFGADMEYYEDRIQRSVTLDPSSDDKLFPFPLYIGQTLTDVAKELNIKVVRCDTECDLEVARIASSLNCPALSLDSDFYIFDAVYIPFDTLKLKPMTCLKTRNNKKMVYKYMACKIFNRNNFLKHNGLVKDMLPLFAVLLGNDYISREFFNRLYQQFRSNFYVKEIVSFLSNTTKEVALQQVLSICNYEETSDIAHRINDAIDGYLINNRTFSKYLTYLDLEESLLDSKPVDEDDINSYIKITCQDTSIIIDNCRKCIYTSIIGRLLFSDTYRLRPQVEDVMLPCSHLISMDIISAIYAILNPSSGQLQCYVRVGLKYEQLLIPPCTISIPPLPILLNMDVFCRQQILYKILGLTDSFVIDCVNIFPDSWKLYIIAIYYFCFKSKVTCYFVYAVLLCRIIIQYVDSKLKKCMYLPKLFFEEHGEAINILVRRNFENIPDIECSIQDTINCITYEDSLLLLQKFIYFFQVKSEIIENVTLFDRCLVHSLAEFQSCLYHIISLNLVLDSPFENYTLMSCFNGTFLYNLIYELRQHSSGRYIQDLLQDSPTISKCFNLMVKTLEKYNIRIDA